MSIYTTFVHIHSGLRWLVLAFILIAIINAAVKIYRKSAANQKDCIFNRLSMILMHLQLVFGLVLYFISPKIVFSAASMKDSLTRFFLVEHSALMIIAIVLVTIGYIKSDRAVDLIRKQKLLLIYYGFALILILVAIPWPFRALGAGWF
jgi:hypothetical protein